MIETKDVRSRVGNWLYKTPGGCNFIFGVTGAFVIYLGVSFLGRSLNPVRALEQIKVDNAYSEDHRKVFGRNGLADINQDGDVTNEEFMLFYEENDIPYRIGIINPTRTITQEDLTGYLSEGRERNNLKKERLNQGEEK